MIKIEGQTVIQYYYRFWNDWFDYWIRYGHIYERMKANKMVKRIGKCVICGSKGKTTLHHIIPMADGGANIKENLVELCWYCHASEHNFKQGFLNRQIKDILNKFLIVGRIKGNNLNKQSVKS